MKRPYYGISIRNVIRLLPVILVFGLLGACSTQTGQQTAPEQVEMKINIYQVFTRLFGNTNTTNQPWGTLEENGVGKFDDFTDEALEAIKEMGITHIWYTGVLHHAMVTGYPEIGIPGDDPDVVKGRAGSPYSVKDYYNVNPDLATNPSNRLEEFQELIDRTHQHGMKVIIDIVPNHVARVYHSVSNPPGVEDFGASDDHTRVYTRDNNYYYIPGEPFRVPQWRDGYQVLGGEDYPGADGYFDENPAKWTGNGSRSPQPDMYDWYEAVKINFGVDPDGRHDFDPLPPGFENMPYQEHYAFWKDRSVPDSWKKYRDIALYWIGMGVDGFRYDMAEMVPVEFWSYMNSAIRMVRPDVFLMAEIYQPPLYRDYIRKGKMDYLYDKVQLYDSLKAIMQGKGSTDVIVQIQDELADVEHHMVHFLENHDEQRIASQGFAGDARKGMPAMVVSATIGSSPTMLYFGQDVGEPANEEPGFGAPGRTSIYDYIGVPHHQRWMNHGKFDGAGLSGEERELHLFYSTLLNFTKNSRALTGNYREIHLFNREHTPGYSDRVFAYVRWKDEDRLIIVTNFDATHAAGFDLQLTAGVMRSWNLKQGEHALLDRLAPGHQMKLIVSGGQAAIRIDLEPLQSCILELQ
jgi:glycosidase